MLYQIFLMITRIMSYKTSKYLIFKTLSTNEQISNNLIVITFYGCFTDCHFFY